MRLAVALFSAFILTGPSFTTAAPVTRAELERLLDSDVHGWRFEPGEVAGAESPDFDDSEWQLVDIGHKWWPHDSTCWFRKRIKIPERINGVDVTGSTVRLKLGMDNEAKAYVDGRLKQRFTWADGNIVLTEDARPGETFCVALHGINGPGYGRLYRAYLVSSASEKMIDAVGLLLHDFEVALSDTGYVPPEEALGWETHVQNARDQIDLTAYRAGQQAAFLKSIERARATLLSDTSGFERSLGRTEKKLAELNKRIDRGRKIGLQLAYRRAEARVIESFLRYARDDMADGVRTNKIRALKIAAFLDRLCGAAVRKTAAALETPALDLGVPAYHTGKITIHDGAFRQDGRPLFFTGVGHFGQVRKDTPILNEYGLNIIQIEMGPAQALPDANTVDQRAIRNAVVRALDNAAAHNVAVNLLVSPHYFPPWALDRNPKLADCGHGFMRYCIEAPDARQVVEKFLRALMPMIADHPALHSICLSNEPQYTGTCQYAANGFRQWLRNKHRTIQTLNKICGTNFRTFDEVRIPKDASNYALHFDWCRFNQDRFLEFHKFERDIIHQYDPDVPVHAKVQAHNFLEATYFETGINYEDFDQLGSITGNDCVQGFVGNGQGPYAQDWLRMAMSYTLQHCTAPANPIFNSEDHIIRDGDWRFIPASHIRAAYWTQALHGQGAATTWVWERSQGGDAAENILTRPNCVLALGTIALDLNRLAKEVVALQRAKTDLAILYSYASLPLSRDYLIETEQAFAGAYFADTVCDFITERQAVAGKLANYKIVVVPNAAHAPDAVVKAFNDYIASGGIVMAVGKCFTRDEYGRKRGSELQPSGSGRLVIYPDPLTSRAYRDILSGLLDASGGERPVRILGEHGEPVWGVNLRAARLDDKLLVNLVNFLRRDQTIDLATNLPITRAVNLFDNADVTLPVTLEPLEPMLLSIETGIPDGE